MPIRFVSIPISASLIVLGGCATYRACDPSPAVVAERQPPHACRMDGCTLSPDIDFVDCCNKHDQLYWQGGTKQQRKDADRDLRQCIAEHDHRLLADYYYLGVRLGGLPWLPTPWRWGFGWDYFHGYDPGGQGDK